MELWEVVLVLAIGLAAGVIPVLSLIIPRAKKNLSSQLEHEYKTTFEKWKAEYQMEAGRNKDQENSDGMKPVRQPTAISAEIPTKYSPADVRFIGGPIEYVVFKNLTKISDTPKQPLEIVFLANSANSDLTVAQRAIKTAIENRRVAFEVMESSKRKDKTITKNAVVTKRYASDGTAVA